MVLIEKRKTWRKYRSLEVYIFDRDGNTIVKGLAVVWPEVKAVYRKCKRGKQRSKAITVQVPKHLEQYNKFTVIIVPRDEAEK